MRDRTLAVLVLAGLAAMAAGAGFGIRMLLDGRRPAAAAGIAFAGIASLCSVRCAEALRSRRR